MPGIPHKEIRCNIVWSINTIMENMHSEQTIIKNTYSYCYQVFLNCHKKADFKNERSRIKITDNCCHSWNKGKKLIHYVAHSIINIFTYEIWFLINVFTNPCHVFSLNRFFIVVTSIISSLCIMHIWCCHLVNRLNQRHSTKI